MFDGAARAVIVYVQLDSTNVVLFAKYRRRSSKRLRMMRTLLPEERRRR